MAIHLDRDYRQHRRENGKNNYYKQAFLNPDIFYDEIEKCIISPDMRNLTAYLRLHNVKMYCLSGIKMSLHSEAKQTFVSRHYGDDIKLLSVGTQEGKVDVVKILQDIYKCSADEILFVDDLPKVVNLMKENGYQSVLVDDINKITVSGQGLEEILDD